MALQLARKARSTFVDLKPMYLLQSVPLVLLAVFCITKAKTAAKELRLFLAVSSLLALAIVLRSNEFNYQVYLVPYSLAALLLVMEQKHEVALFRWVTPLLLYGFFAAVLLSKLVKYNFRADGDFNELISHLDAAPLWKGKAIFVAGGPDISTYLMMKGEAVERQVPVPQAVAPAWFDKYNHVIEVRENGVEENKFEEPDKPRPWRTWKASAYTTMDSAYTITQYARQ
jgi:hypothetical protein